MYRDVVRLECSSLYEAVCQARMNPQEISERIAERLEEVNKESASTRQQPTCSIFRRLVPWLESRLSLRHGEDWLTLRHKFLGAENNLTRLCMCAAVNVAEEHIANFFGLNDSKYQWAVDEYMKQQLVGLKYLPRFGLLWRWLESWVSRICAQNVTLLHWVSSHRQLGISSKTCNPLAKRRRCARSAVGTLLYFPAARTEWKVHLFCCSPEMPL